MNWLYYLAEANLYLAVFYLAYCAFLAKETYYQLNRTYLLLSSIMAFILPVLQLETLKPQITATTPTLTYTVTQPVQNPEMVSIVTTPAAATGNSFTIDDYVWTAYIVGAIILLLLLALKLYSVFKLIRNNKTVLGNYKMVYLNDSDTAFSFFNYLFIGVHAEGAKTIIKHELVHIRQKHSADIIFLELLKVVCWFNPVVYLLQNSLKTVHEYIADEQTAADETDALTYSSFLVKNAYGMGGSSITHSFFNYNLLKKRIIMLNQQRSGKLARLKYLVALPLCAGLLCVSTLAFSKTYGWINLSPETKSAFVTVKTTLNDTLTTPKGFKYKEKIYSKNGQKYAEVTFFEGGGKTKTITSSPMTKSKLVLLKQYGYDFPQGTVPPPPPPMPPKPKVDQVKFPPGVLKRKKTDVVKFPPPVVDGRKWEPGQIPPPEPPKPKVDQVRFPTLVKGEAKITAKGYSFEETGYLIDGKETNFRVIIHEKNGKQKAFFRNNATKAQLKLLKDKYGYTFPTMEIHNQLPPPPPAEPMASPDDKSSGTTLGYRNSHGAVTTKMGLNNVVYSTDTDSKRKFLPLIIVNNQRFKLSEDLQKRFNNGEHLVFSASDSTVTYLRNTPYAIAKWGRDAAEGVVALYGAASVSTSK